jgi:hypothetical protein
MIVVACREAGDEDRDESGGKFHFRRRMQSNRWLIDERSERLLEQLLIDGIDAN